MLAAAQGSPEISRILDGQTSIRECDLKAEGDPFAFARATPSDLGDPLPFGQGKAQGVLQTVCDQAKRIQENCFSPIRSGPRGS
jgi:hypothetical protein